MADLGDPGWRGMMCVEAGNVADNEVRLAAGGEHGDVDGDLREGRAVTLFLGLRAQAAIC
jgi:hypothetical protein